MLGIKIFWLAFACVQLSRAEILGQIKLSQLEITESRTDGDVVDRRELKMGELRICSGTKSTHPSGWIVRQCEEITEGRNMYFSIESSKMPTHIITFAKSAEIDKSDSKTASGSTSLTGVIITERNSYAVVLPLMFPHEDISHRIEVINGIRFKVSLECAEKHFGPRCERYCDSSVAGRRFKCHPQTGEIVCSFGWIGKDCFENVFIDRKSAFEFLKNRPKRSEERNDCSKRACTVEEVRDEFLQQGSDLTEEAWAAHRGGENLSACESYCDKNGTLLCVKGEPGEQNLCRCKEGYEGETCSEIDLCYFEPCSNGGSCENTPEGVVCECPEGFKGDFCEFQKNYCQNNPCGYHGECESDPSGFRCVCDRGFAGETCEVNVDDCTAESCSGRGTCEDGINSYDCVCEDGFFGKNCEEAKDGCLSVPCLNGGKCSSFDDGYFECHCKQGFEGETCENKTVNPCDPGPCNGNGQCHVVWEEDDSAESSYKETAFCVCDSGYAGKHCEIAATSCEAVEFPCPHNATCINLESEYICRCSPGYEGENCEKECDPCEERVELRCEKDPCENGARCLMMGGNATCLCAPGFTGERCETAIDFCEGVSCEHGECVSQKGSFLCFCEPGYSGPLCEEDWDECKEEHFLCKNEGQCRNTFGGYQCLCLKGFAGEHCDHKIDACSSTPCLNGGTCYPDEGDTYTCQCEIGFVGFICENTIDFCADEPSPCQNGGKCEVASLAKQETKCTCSERFYGDFCENVVPICMVKQQTADGSHELANRTECGSYGKCIPDRRQDFVCECLEGYEGDFCNRRTMKIKECVEPYCVCGAGILNFKALPTKYRDAAECHHSTYGKGKCRIDECLSRNCTEKSKLTCQYELECTEKKISSRRAYSDATNNSCERLWLNFEREKLPQDSSLEKICDVLRNLDFVPSVQDSVIKCSLVAKTNSVVEIFASLKSSKKSLNARTIKDELFHFFTHGHLNQTLDAAIGRNAVEILSAAKNVSDSTREALVGWHRESDSFDSPVDGQPGPNLQNNTAVIIAATFAVIIALGFLLTGLVLWLKKRKPAPSPTPVTRPSENNNVPVGSVTWSKVPDGKSTSFENPLCFGLENNASANSEKAGPTSLSTVQQRVEEERSETETTSRNGVSTFISRNRVCSGSVNGLTDR